MGRAGSSSWPASPVTVVRNGWRIASPAMTPWSEQQRHALVEDLIEAIPELTLIRLEVIALMVQAFSVEMDARTLSDSDFASAAFAEAFGDVLLIHHTLSSESFTKDKFEHGLQAILRRLGHEATLAPRGNPGHDITVGTERWSLKTQADRGIKSDRIHISKFMELGRGQWRDESDLVGLRERMFEHMRAYDRIFTLRCLSAASSRAREGHHEYELVEIPKLLLERARNSPCLMRHDSRQTPKPGSCVVRDAGAVSFELYFDGGTERKLQIRDLAKSECRVHASWRFPREARSA